MITITYDSLLLLKFLFTDSMVVKNMTEIDSITTDKTPSGSKRSRKGDFEGISRNSESININFKLYL